MCCMGACIYFAAEKTRASLQSALLRTVDSAHHCSLSPSLTSFKDWLTVSCSFSPSLPLCTSPVSKSEEEAASSAAPEGVDGSCLSRRSIFLGQTSLDTRLELSRGQPLCVTVFIWRSPTGMHQLRVGIITLPLPVSLYCSALPSNLLHACYFYP